MWTAPKIQALLLKTPKPIQNLKVGGLSRGVRPPSPRGTAAQERTGYSK